MNYFSFKKRAALFGNNSDFKSISHQFCFYHCQEVQYILDSGTEEYEFKYDEAVLKALKENIFF